MRRAPPADPAALLKLTLTGVRGSALVELEALMPRIAQDPDFPAVRLDRTGLAVLALLEGIEALRRKYAPSGGWSERK